MKNVSRRSILRIGGLVTGGLILPWAGNKAFALTEPAAVADLDVVETAFPASAEIQRFRSMSREHADWRVEATIAQHYKDDVDLAQFAERRRLGVEPATSFRTGEPLATEVGRRREAWQAYAATIWMRPVRSWGDVAELAEIAWTAAPKVGDRWDCYGQESPIGETPVLMRERFDKQHKPHQQRYLGDFSMAANAALIEGVLTMAGGERYDPLYDFDRRWSAYQHSR